MIIRYRNIEGEKVHCCRVCKYISKDLKKCKKSKREFEHHDDCPPFWCPFSEGME